MPKNSYEKRFKPDDVLTVLKDNPGGLMLSNIQKIMGCSEMTARNLLKPLIESRQVVKLNIGSSEKRPVNLYSLP